MSVQTVVNSAPEVAFPGQITHVIDPFAVNTAIAEAAIPVASGVVKGTDLAIDESNTDLPYKVILPSADGQDFIGVAVRADGSTLNDTGSPVWPIDEPVSLLTQGSVYVRLKDDASVARGPVYLVHTASGNYLPGDLSPVNLGGAAVTTQITRAYWYKTVAANGLAEVVITAKK
jgi:hypothetical protein